MKNEIMEAYKFGFTTDGCTLSPDGNWFDCCLEHDFAYWKGGTSEERKAADKKLRECMRAKGYYVLPWVYYYGVRLFGSHFFKSGPMWGYKDECLKERNLEE
jgi:hypothetical protein